MSAENAAAANPAWWLDSLLQFLAIGCAGWVVVWQMNRQHKDNSKLQRDHLKSKLHLQIYHEISESIFETENAIIGAMIPPTLLAQRLALNYQSRAELGRDSLEIGMTSATLLDDSHKATESLARMLRIIERYEIALPTFQSLRRRAGQLVERISSEFDMFLEVVSPFLPMRVPGDGAKDSGAPKLPLRHPQKEDLEKIGKAARQYSGVCRDATAFCMDLRIASQNHLLSGLFGGTVPPRNPMDPSVEVFGLDLKPLEKRPPGRVI